VPHARRDGVELFYERSGEDEPGLLFVPGWCCGTAFFQPQIDYFSRSHAVVATDPRGCGRSPQSEGGYDIPSLAADVAAVARESGLERPVVLGHSLGGMIGIELAASHPSAVSAVVAVDPGPIDPLPEARELFLNLADGLESADGEDARRAYVEEVGSRTPDVELRRWIVESMCSAPLEVAAAMIRGVNEWDGVAAFESCDVPLLVLRSTPMGSNAPERLLARKPDVQIGITVGAGHFHQLEVPEQVNAMIERFLASLG
jgi:pimeloyl-ACP methyl ester carboxylesterase